MTNLEKEMKLKMLDEEELEFQNPIEDDGIDFDIVDDSVFIIETDPSEAPKSVSTTGKSSKDKKPKKEASESVTGTSTEQIKDKEKTKKAKTNAKQKKQVTAVEGTDAPVFRVVPVVEEPEETEPENTTREDVSDTVQSTTEEFEEPKPTTETEETLEGEVEGAAQTIEFHTEDRQDRQEFTEAPDSSSQAYQKTFSGNYLELLKQIGSLVAILTVFFICFKSYGVYIEKNTNKLDHKEATTIASNVKETAIEKTSESLSRYEDQSKEKREEIQNKAAEISTASSQESNLVKLDRIIEKKTGEPTEEVTPEEATEARFANLTDLTKYINQNTLLLYDILDNTEKRYAAGEISIEEYSEIYSKAKEKLTELTTLLTTNENVYEAEQQINDYDVLIENINTINDTY